MFGTLRNLIWGEESEEEPKLFTKGLVGRKTIKLNEVSGLKEGDIVHDDVPSEEDDILDHFGGVLVEKLKEATKDIKKVESLCNWYDSYIEKAESVRQMKRVYNVANFGSLSSGKSALLNFLMKEDAFPEGDYDCTQCPIICKYSRTPRFVITRYDGENLTFPEDGRDVVREVVLKKFRSIMLDPDHLVNPKYGEENYKKIELFMDLEILKRMTLIDLPRVVSSGRDDDEGEDTNCFSSLGEDVDLMIVAVPLNRDRNISREIFALEQIKDEYEKRRVRKSNRMRAGVMEVIVVGTMFDKIASPRDAKIKPEMPEFAEYIDVNGPKFHEAHISRLKEAVMDCSLSGLTSENIFAISCKPKVFHPYFDELRNEFAEIVEKKKLNKIQTMERWRLVLEDCLTELGEDIQGIERKRFSNKLVTQTVKDLKKHHTEYKKNGRREIDSGKIVLEELIRKKLTGRKETIKKIVCERNFDESDKDAGSFFHPANFFFRRLSNVMLQEISPIVERQINSLENKLQTYTENAIKQISIENRRALGVVGVLFVPTGVAAGVGGVGFAALSSLFITIGIVEGSTGALLFVGVPTFLVGVGIGVIGGLFSVGGVVMLIKQKLVMSNMKNKKSSREKLFEASFKKVVDEMTKKVMEDFDDKSRKWISLISKFVKKRSEHMANLLKLKYPNDMHYVLMKHYVDLLSMKQKFFGGKINLERCRGMGGAFGQIWEGTLDGEKVIMKVIPKKLGQEVCVLREVFYMSRLSHENLVKFRSFFYHGDKSMCIVMKNHQMDFFDFVRSGRRLTLPEVMRLSSQLIGGVSYLHRMDYFHRDIKSKNIFIEEEEESNEKRLVIGDYSYIRHFEDRNAGSFPEEEKGTPGYFNPEHYFPDYLGDKHFGKRLDVFSTGITMAELWNQKFPMAQNLRMAQSITKRQWERKADVKKLIEKIQKEDGKIVDNFDKEYPSSLDRLQERYESIVAKCTLYGSPKNIQDVEKEFSELLRDYELSVEEEEEEEEVEGEDDVVT